MQVAGGGFFLGLVLGLVGASAKLSAAWLPRVLGGAYTTIVRGVPDILVILLFFYGGTEALRAVVRLVSPEATVTVGVMPAGIAALAFVAGAYATEVLRGAIQAVPRPQFEAARALALPRRVLWTKVVLPQALRLALPGLGNLWLVVTKDSALVSVVGARDLLGAGATAAASTRLPFVFYTAVAFVFLAISLASMALFAWAERRTARSVAR